MNVHVRVRGTTRLMNYNNKNRNNSKRSSLQIQWNPSITDTIGTSKLVLLIEVSFVEGSFNIIKYQNGTRKVSLVVRCPLFRGVLYKGVPLYFNLSQWCPQ